MQKHLNFLFWLLVVIVISRLFSMAILPMIGTSEARYAEIARIMSESGDWITPWFDYDVPFWGKPPLSFWLEAISFNIFGISEFSARLPSWLVNLGILALIYHLTRYLAGPFKALIACLLFSTMSLSFTMSGAVLTDPFLALGTSLSLVSVIFAMRQPLSNWRWWFFVGLAIGLLAKGPLALVLVGGPLFMWMIWRRRWRDLFANLPWFRGLLLTVLTVLPWYLLAEFKTPGFINYFIIGEHFFRFIDPGWSGDLYGDAHKQPYGTIWVYWLWSTFPWGPLAVIALLLRYFKRKTNNSRLKLTDEQRLLVLSSLFPSLFFTFSGNILWTYQLPALIPLAILIVQYIPNSLPSTNFGKLTVVSSVSFVPLLLMVLGFYGYFYPEKLKTEKTLVAYYKKDKKESNSELIYMGKLPFSARFYSKGRVSTKTIEELKTLLDENDGTIYYIAVPSKNIDNVMNSFFGMASVVATNKRFSLLKIVKSSVLSQV